MDNRSPLENIFNIIGGLPQGHDKPVKHALYNAVALFLLALICAAGWALFIILEPFFKPLVWALLVGSVLHPLKHGLREQFRKWFNEIEESGTPIVLGLCVLPISITNNISEFIGSNLIKYIKTIAAIGISLVALHILYYYTPTFVSFCIWKIVIFAYKAINFFISNASTTMAVLLVIGYLSATAVLWTPKNNNKFHVASSILWTLLSCFVAHLFGSLQIFAFIILQLIFAAGFILEVYELQNEMKKLGHEISIMEAILLIFNGGEGNQTEIPSPEASTGDQPLLNTKEKENSTEKSATNPPKIETINDKTKTNQDPWSLELFDEVKPEKLEANKGRAQVPKQNLLQATGLEGVGRNAKRLDSKITRSLSQPHVNTSPYLRYRSGLYNLYRKASIRKPQNLEETQYASDFYIYSLIWACVIMIFWKNTMLLPILPIPILIYLMKHVGFYLGIWSMLHSYWCKIREAFYSWCSERTDALLPVSVRGLYRATQKANVALKNGIKDSIDTVASCVVILALIVFVACASIFIVFQIYTEAIMLVQMFSNVINQTVVHNPELRQLLPPTWDETVDSILDNAYQYGREGISKAVRSIMNDVDTEKSSKLENQVLELWDRVYQTWMSSNDAHGPKVTQAAVETSWNAFLDDIKKSPELFNITALVEFVKQNIGTLMSLLESVWLIVKGNISLVLSSFSAFLSVILGGGTAVLNFILNVIVFLTTLFYLLSSSGDFYKPIELMTKFSSSSSRFGLALEGAVNGVFKASFKMAVFYGMWTWFIHNLFGVKIVYLPSAFATLLGAIPFLGTYWACIPAVLDLWLAQDKGILAILFAVFQFLPTSVVDTTIYKEIKGGGHPYLTGLAIAGGIFCLGVEGAIVGPLLLCGLYVAMDLSSNLFKDSPSEESLNIQLQLQNA